MLIEEVRACSVACFDQSRGRWWCPGPLKISMARGQIVGIFSNFLEFYQISLKVRNDKFQNM